MLAFGFLFESLLSSRSAAYGGPYINKEVLGADRIGKPRFTAKRRNLAAVGKPYSRGEVGPQLRKWRYSLRAMTGADLHPILDF